MTLEAKIEGTASAEQRGAAVPSLGRNADFASTPNTHELTKVTFREVKGPVSTAQVRNWHLRSVARDILKRAGVHKRVRWCGEKISYRERGVSVYRRPDRPTGRLAGVCVCGQSIVCPVCAPRIAAFRAAEIAQAFTNAKALGFEAYLDTMTMPHRTGNDLGHEVDTFALAWRDYVSGRKSNFLRVDYLGNHTAREITFGDNGWHYHHHQLRYHKPGSHDTDRAKALWLSSLHTVGRWTPDAIEYAYHSAPVRDEQGATYTAKISTACTASSRAAGLEVAMSSTKGRNIVTLLADHAAGIETAGGTWLEGVKAVVQRKISSVRWSAGLRADLGLATVEKTDESIALEEALPTDEFLGVLTTHQWRAIINQRAEYVLVRCAQQGRDAVNCLLEGLDLGPLHEELAPAKEGKR